MTNILLLLILISVNRLNKYHTEGNLTVVIEGLLYVALFCHGAAMVVKSIASLST